MKNKTINDEKSAVQYIQHVLTDWVAFCNDHPVLVQALEVLLKTRELKSEALLKIFTEIESKSHITFINGNEDNPILLVDYEFYNELKANTQREKDNEQRKAD